MLLLKRIMCHFPSQPMPDATGQVVFAGYGIVMPGGWNDFAEIDASGKWVLAIIGDPEPENPQSEFIAYASDRMKAINARDHGAAGLLLVKGPSIEKEDKLMPAYYDKTASDAGIPVINITRKLANHLIRQGFYHRRPGKRTANFHASVFI
jgi:aminopeptidase YwaD